MRAVRRVAIPTAAIVQPRRGRRVTATSLATWLKRAAPFVGVALAAWLIQRALKGLTPGDIYRSLSMLAPVHVGLAGVLAIGSYVALTGFDTCGVCYVGARIPYRRIALTSFLALSIGHTIGFGAVSSGAIRLRLYTRYGLSVAAVAQIVAMCAVTVALGLTMLAGLGVVSSPRVSAELFAIERQTTTVVGIALLSVSALYLCLVAAVRGTIHVRGHSLRLPSFRLALAQLAIGTCNFLLVAGVLHQLLRAAGADIGYLTVATLYTAGNIAAIITHVPGGLGVIEAAVLSVLPSGAVIGALVAFRVIYYLVPFVIGLALLAAFEWTHHRQAPQ